MSKYFETGAMFTSNSDEWSTPQDLFDELDAEFGFDLDPCASADNHKCGNYFTITDDGLKHSWGVLSILQSTLFSDR